MNKERYHSDPEYREKVLSYRRKWYYKNRDYAVAYSVKWAQENPDKVTKNRLNFKRKNYPLPTRPEPSNCEICGKESKINKRLCLDHNHKTEKFRGWICSNCNIGLGNFKDNPDLLQKALEYLKKHDSN